MENGRLVGLACRVDHSVVLFRDVPVLIFGTRVEVDGFAGWFTSGPSPALELKAQKEQHSSVTLHPNGTYCPE